MMTFVEILLLALSLSVDSFVVSLGGSVTLGRVSVWKVLYVALIFGTVQAVLLFAGWGSGYTIVAYISKVAHYISLAILAYLGIRMIFSGIRKDTESVDLSGIRSMVVASVATSIDAMAVGVSLAMSDMKFPEALLVCVLTFVITVAASSAGIKIGSASGLRFGNIAKILGGLVLIFIGLRPFLSL